MKYKTFGAIFLVLMFFAVSEVAAEKRRYIGYPSLGADKAANFPGSV